MKTILSTLLLLWPLLSATAQTTCAGSIEINLANSTLFGTEEALNWYVFSPSQDGRLVLSCIDPSGNGEGIEVYSGCSLGSPTGQRTPQNQCDCCSRDGREKKEYTLISGTDAYIAVPFQSSYQFTWIPAGSIELLRCGELYSRSTLRQQNNYNTYSCLVGGYYYNYNGPDAIFKVEKTVDPGYLNVSLFADGAPLDVFVFEEVSGGIRCIARGIQNNDPLGTSFDFFIDRPPPRQADNYYIIVDSPSEGSDFRISVTCEPLNCNDAQTLECGKILTRETNCGGANRAMAYRTTTGSPEFMGYNAPEKKYIFTLDKTTEVSITLSNIDPGEKLDLFLLNACEEYNLIAASDQVFEGGSETIQTRLSAGTYYVVVDGFDGSVSEFDLSLNYDNCIDLPDICDLAATYVDLGNTFSRTVSSTDVNPVLLQQFDCVRNTFGDVDIHVLYADLFSYFHAEDGVFRLEFIHEELDPSRTKAFAFRCDCSGPSGCGAVCEGAFEEVDEGFFVYEDAPAGFYYLLVVSLDTGPYTFKMTPSGPCSNEEEVTPLACGDRLANQELDLSVDNNFNFGGSGDPGMAYNNCYNGSRTYQGPDKVYELAVDDYQLVDITLQTTQPMGIFLFNDLCGRNCLDFAEVDEGESTAQIEGVRLTPGINYLIIDHDLAAGGGTYDLHVECRNDPSPFFVTADIVQGGQPCPALTDSIHFFTITDLENTQIYNLPVQPNDEIFFLYEDDNGNEIQGANGLWNPGGITVELAADDPSGDIDLKCGWRESDPIKFRYRRANVGGSSSTFYRVEADFRIVEGQTNATDTFLIGGQSWIENIRPVEVSNLSVTPTTYRLSNRAASVDIRVLTDASWIVQEQPLVDWLSFTPLTGGPGSGIIQVTLDENTTTQTRETSLIIITDEFSVQEITIMQRPFCTPPQVNAGPDKIFTCASPNVQLEGSFSGIPNNATVEWVPEGEGQIISGANTLTPSVTGAGIYQLIVTDEATGCMNSDQVLVLADTDTPEVKAAAPQTLTCARTSVVLDATASSGDDLQFSWSAGNGADIVDGANTATPTVDAPGLYTLTVTQGSNGCFATTSVTVPQDIEPPLAEAGPEKVLNCNITSVRLDGTQSEKGVNIAYQWSTPDGNILADADQQTPLVDAPGTYTILVSNADNGCTNTDLVQVIQRAPVTALVQEKRDVLCHGQSNGFASLEASGGLPPYTFSWSTGGAGPTQNNLPADLHRVTITDQEDCQVIRTVDIDEPEPLQISATSTAETAVDANDGTATATASGGTPPYTFEWNNGPTGEKIEGLAPNTYSVTVTDNNGCTAPTTVSVGTVNCTLAVVFSAQDATCADASDGVVTAMVDNAAGQPSFQWSNDATGATISDLLPGTYSVTVNDDQNCEAFGSITIGVNDVVKPTLMTRNIKVFLDENGEVQITPEDVDNGSTDNCSIRSRLLDKERFTCADLGNITVTLTVSDVNRNTASKTALISVADTLSPTISCPANIRTSSCTVVYDLPLVTDNCVALAPDLIEGLPSGAAFPEGSTLVTYAALDESGNRNTCSFEIEVTPPANPVEVEVDTISEASMGHADGFIEIQVSGGQPPYEFEWLRDGEAVSAEQNPSQLPPGDYDLEITDGSDCLYTFGPFFVGTRSTSINDPQLLRQVKLFPNPTPGKVLMKMDFDRSHPVEVRIYDHLGRAVLRTQRELLRNQSYEWDLSDHADGLYLVKMQIGRDLLIWKILLTE